MQRNLRYKNKAFQREVSLYIEEVGNLYCIHSQINIGAVFQIQSSKFLLGFFTDFCKEIRMQNNNKNSGGFEETAGVCLYKTAYIKLKFSLQLLLLQQSQFYTSSSILLVLQTLRKYHLPPQILVL